MKYFEYGATEIEHLRQQDQRLGVAMDRIGMIQREVTPDVFVALVQSIVSQQISTKAAQTVGNRMVALLDDQISPQSIVRVGQAAIQSCGISNRKASYIVGMAEAALMKVVDFDALSTLTDAEIIKKLTSLKGVGAWTAEMLLIFSLCRPDVVSYGDLAIRRGMMKLYDLPDLSKGEFENYRQRYSPFGSVASLYLWALSVA